MVCIYLLPYLRFIKNEKHMKRITFEQALDFFLKESLPLTVTAENNLYPESSSFTWEVWTVKELCSIFSEHGYLYYDIQIFA